MNLGTKDSYRERNFVDPETGAVHTLLEMEEAKKRKPVDARRRQREPFVMVFDTKVLSDTATNLTDRLFWYFVGQTEYDHYIQPYLTAQIASRLGSTAQMVTQAITKLEKQGRVFRVRRYQLAVNPRIVWRGTPAGRDRAVSALREIGKLP